MTSATGKARVAGQTLLELLLAISLVVLVLGLALGTLPSRTATVGSLEMVDDTVQTIRRAATTSGRTLALVWDATAGTLTWTPPAAGAEPVVVKLPREPGLRFTAADKDARITDRFLVQFRPDGGCDPFWLVITPVGKLPVTYQIDVWTGRISVMESGS